MKLMVIGLDCAAPELLFGDEQLVHLRHLMATGTYGRLESVVPPITVPAWLCMATGLDPGTLGIYGFRNRPDRGYGMQTIDARAVRELTVWDQIAREGGRSVIVGVPPSHPPRRINGLSVGCFLTPSTDGVFTHPPELSDEIRELVGEYPVDVEGFRTEDKDWLHERILAMTDAHFEVVRHLAQTQEWDYFQCVEIGLDRMHHGFWQCSDPEHVKYVAGNPHEHAIRDYYRLLDAHIGQLLQLLDDQTVVLVVSDHGAQRLDGGFCINEWLMREGLLVLNEQPDGITPFDELDIDWSRTTCWGRGGYYARVFLNLRGREPHGLVDPAEALALREDIATRLEAALPGTVAHRPERIYREVRGVPPDLIVHLGDLFWRAIGSIGHGALQVQENDTGPDGCNHAQHGAYILAGPGVTAGQRDAHLLDIAPTLLNLGGYEVPPAMQGHALFGDVPVQERSDDEERIVRDRLSGLGYIG